MISLIYRIFGKRVGRIIAGVVCIVLGFVYLQLNLSDTTLTSNSDWFYCAILFIVGILFIASNFLNIGRKQPAQSGQPQPPAGQPYAQWSQSPTDQQLMGKPSSQGPQAPILQPQPPRQ